MPCIWAGLGTARLRRCIAFSCRWTELSHLGGAATKILLYTIFLIASVFLFFQHYGYEFDKRPNSGRMGYDTIKDMSFVCDNKKRDEFVDGVACSIGLLVI
jgi:hypothetical protein